MTTREEVEALAKWHEHQLTFVPDGDNALSKHHTNAAALLRSLLAERESFYMEYRMKCDAETKKLLVRAEKAEIALDAEQRHSQLMRERVTKAEAERDEAIKHGGAFSRARITCNGYSDWSKEALDEAFEAFRVWMEERE